MTAENCTRLSLSQRDHPPLDLQGPVLSVETIVAIVISILLTVATIIIIVYFLRYRSRGSIGPVGGTHNARTTQPPDIELTSQPPQPVRSPTDDQGVPTYEPSILPTYCEKQIPSLNPSSSSRSF